MTGDPAGEVGELAHVESGQGVPVVLLHAFPLWSAVWDQQRSAAPTGLRMLTPDLRGFGASPLGASAEPPSLDAMADDVAAWMKATRIPAAVVGGLSLGGYVAMAMLRRHPERVRGLVLADTKASADDDAARARRLAMADAAEADGARVLAPMIDVLLGETSRRARPSLVGAVRQWMDRARPDAVAWTQRAMAARPESFDTLAAASVPALVLVGAEDVLTPVADAVQMVDTLPDATLATIAAAGHLSPVEAPDDVSAALFGFLERFR